MPSNTKTTSISVSEFLTKCQDKNLFDNFDQIVAIELNEPVLQQVLKTFLTRQVKGGLSVYFCADITREWIDSKYLNFDLFSQEETIFIYDCEKIKKEDYEYLIGLANEGNRQLILLFNKEIQKRHIGPCLKVKKSPFWEAVNDFKLFLNFQGIKLSGQALRRVSAILESDHDQIYNILNSIQSLSGKEIDESIIDKILPKLSLNQFELVDHLNKKNIKVFFNCLASINSYDELYRVVNFSISHLIKISSPPQEISKLNKYNQKIVNASKLWSEREISGVLGVMKEVLVQARLKNKKALINVMKASFN